MNPKRSVAMTLMIWACLAFMTSTSRAGLINFDVSINTSSLVGNANGPFALDLQLNDGSGPAGNNTATISGVSFGAGGSLGAVVPGNIGTFSGSLASALILTDANPSTDFTQFFTPGSALTFHVALTTNLNTGSTVTPDLFSVGILYSNSLLGIPTLGSLGQFVSVTIDRANPTLQAFASDSGPAPHFNIPTPQISTVPEPGSLLLIGNGLIGIAIFAGLRGRAARGLPDPPLGR